MDDRRERMRTWAAEAIDAGTPTAWFEPFYQEAGGDARQIPWADGEPHPMLTGWLSAEQPVVSPGSALVVGCGLGDDAAWLAGHGWQVTAFDISPTAVAWAGARFPDLPVDWQVADALNLAEAWHDRFDLIVEIYTLQTLPAELRPPLLRQLADCLAPGGRMLVICRGRDEDEDPSRLPWKLAWSELNSALEDRLQIVRNDDLLDDETPPQRRFRGLYRRRG